MSNRFAGSLLIVMGPALLAAGLIYYDLTWVNGLLLAAALLGLGVLDPLTGAAGSAFPSLVRWARNLGFLAWGALALDSLKWLQVDGFPRLANPGGAWSGLSEEGRVDPHIVFALLGVGFWLFVINLAAFRGRSWSPVAALGGMATGVLAGTTGVLRLCSYPDLPVLDPLYSALTGFAIAIWCLWVGVELWRGRAGTTRAA